MFVVALRMAATGLPTRGQPFTPGHAARPANRHRWPITPGCGSLPPRQEPSDCDLSASNAVGVSQYRGQGDRRSNELSGPHTGRSAAWTPVAPTHTPTHMTRDGKTAEPAAQGPRGKATLSGTSPDTDGTRTPRSGGHPAKRIPGTDRSP